MCVKMLTRGPEAREDRHATALLHDESSARIVAFHLAPGQSVSAHRSDSMVIVIVTEGAGLFRGEDGSAKLSAGEGAVYAPGEMHAIDAGAEPLRFLAVITPRPGG